MTVAIDKYGEVSMKLSDWDDIRKWLDANPLFWEMSFGEAVRLYVAYVERGDPE